MMMIAVIEDKQSFFDLAIQEYGSINELFDFALANDVSITNSLEPGTNIKVPELKVSKPQVQAYYKRKSLSPSTGLSQTDISNMTHNPCDLASLFL